mgnify:CR=1 FL=1
MFLVIVMYLHISEKNKEDEIMTDINLPIASKGFALLVLDHEWNGCPEMKLKPGCYCRILIDGW